MSDLSNNLINQTPDDGIFDNFINEILNVFPISTDTSLLSSPQTLNNLLSSSLYQKNKYKKITSPEEIENLKQINYKKDEQEISCCPIMQVDFNEDEKVTKLPCNHIFNTAAIKQWLEEESYKCPVCRYKMPFIEKKIIPENQITQQSQTEQTQTEQQQQTLQGSNFLSMLQQMTRLQQQPRPQHWSQTVPIHDEDSNDDMPQLEEESDDDLTNIEEDISNNNQTGRNGFLELLSNRITRNINRVMTRQNHEQEERDLQEVLYRSMCSDISNNY